MGQIQIFNGTSWVNPQAVYSFNGLGWDRLVGYYWTGTQWLPFINYQTVSAQRLYHCSFENPAQLYEMNFDNLSWISGSGVPPGLWPTEIGGIRGRLYHCDAISIRLYELHPDNFSVLREAAPPGSLPTGIGGTRTRLFHCDFNFDMLYELNPDTLAVIRQTASPGTSPVGIGGTSTRLFHGDRATLRLYELNPDTFAVIRQGIPPGTYPFGTGGIDSRLYHADESGFHLIYELHPDTFAILQEAGGGFNPAGMGGIKS